MIFWIIAALLAGLAGLWMALPFLRARSMEMSGAEGAISIYRDQLDEVDRDRAAGLISEAECEAARMEIERRALVAARHMDQGMAISTRAPVLAAGLTGLAAALVLGGYAWLGAPGAADAPLAARRAEALAAQAAAGDLGSRIQLLIERSQDDPESFETWWMLASSYSAIGDHASAADAYRHAVELAGDKPGVLSAYAEAMTLANGNKVPTAALVIFDKLAAETGDPRARYYLALARAQAQDFEGALERWAALARDSAPDAPWMGMVRRDIVNMARFLKVDVTESLPDATAAEIAAAGGAGAGPGGDLAARIAGLEVALAAEPKDYKSWIALAEARLQSGDEIGGAAALGQARREYAAAPFVLQKIDEAERALGLDLTAPAPARRGLDAEDIAAASALSDQEREDMIDGMVAGLAARLEEQPEDLQGWVMLVNSYRTLGKPSKAQDAHRSALRVFGGDPAAVAALERAVGAAP
ncbi:MAG: c-type cytochrome biogenesis protein CcmI [Mangrovicoccus sp.]|nr:c-type cytochrome biogenesis protein CcmI [Mangrovicoccus sp.]